MTCFPPPCEGEIRGRMAQHARHALPEARGKEGCGDAERKDPHFLELTSLGGSQGTYTRIYRKGVEDKGCGTEY